MTRQRVDAIKWAAEYIRPRSSARVSSVVSKLFQLPSSEAKKARAFVALAEELAAWHEAKGAK